MSESFDALLSSFVSRAKNAANAEGGNKRKRDVAQTGGERGGGGGGGGRVRARDGGGASAGSRDELYQKDRGNGKDPMSGRGESGNSSKGAETGALGTMPESRAKAARPKVNFLVVGMQKGGTSWLYKMLLEHPGIALSNEKEVHYWDIHFKKDDAWYERQFPRDVDGKVVGDVTPDYLSLWSEKVGKIYKYNPKMKIIIISRDEIDRAWSSFLMWCRIEGKVVAAMDEESILNTLTNEYYQSRGDLGSGLRNYLQEFPKEQIFIGDFADIRGRPQALMDDIFAFLGVPQFRVDEAKLTTNFQVTTDRSEVVENKANSVPKALKEKLQLRLEEAYRPMVKANRAALKRFRRDHKRN